MGTRNNDRPAILGGRPVRPGGPLLRLANRPEILAALEHAYRDGDWHRYHGHGTERLREALAVYHNVTDVELCCSGTAALEIALKGVNVKPGYEVLVSGYDFKGVVSSVLAVGAVPVVVDSQLDTPAFVQSQLERSSSPKMRAAIVSHLHGMTAAIRPIVEWAHQNGVAIVEDACQTHGAMIDGKRAGAWGDVGVLSFGGSKLLTAGRGGALLTSDPRIAQRIRLHCERGNHAFPMSELQAAVLLPQLESLDADNRKRLASVEWLTKRLRGSPVLPVDWERLDASPAFYKLGLMPTDDCWSGLNREIIAAALRAEGVAIDEGFKSVPELFARSRFRQADSLIVAELLGKWMLVLHHPVLLADEEELSLVVRAVQKIAAAAARGELAGVASA